MTTTTRPAAGNAVADFARSIAIAGVGAVAAGAMAGSLGTVAPHVIPRRDLVTAAAFGFVAAAAGEVAVRGLTGMGVDHHAAGTVVMGAGALTMLAGVIRYTRPESGMLSSAIIAASGVALLFGGALA